MRRLLFCLALSACGDTSCPTETVDAAESPDLGLLPCSAYTDCVPGRSCLNEQGDIVTVEFCGQ